MALNPQQIAQAAWQAGWRGDELAEIVAVAMAESGGDPNEVNPSGEYSVGLTQINMNAHGSRFGSEQQLRDPVHNLRAARQLYQETGSFRPWSVHRSSPSPHAGMSDQHLPQARRAARAIQGTGGGQQQAWQPGGWSQPQTAGPPAWEDMEFAQMPQQPQGPSRAVVMGVLEQMQQRTAGAQAGQGLPVGGFQSPSESLSQSLGDVSPSFTRPQRDVDRAGALERLTGVPSPTADQGGRRPAQRR